MSDYKDIIKHTINYFIATISTKALSFISIPVYTYLLTVEEYGVFNTFTSAVSIVTILLTLNSEVAISRYYYDAKNDNDFKCFVGTSIILTLGIFTINSLIFIITIDDVSRYFKFEKLLTLSILPLSLYSILDSCFQQIYQPMLKSRKIALITSIQAYVSFILSVICIWLLDEKKYYGQVLGTLSAMLLIGSYYIFQIKSYVNVSFRWKYIKYILNYSIPYLPYSLSGIIIIQFGRIIIGQQEGFDSAGLYSFASNIALLMMLVITVFHMAWNPYYYRYMNNMDYHKLDKDYDIIWRITLIMGAIISLFSFDIGNLLARKEFIKGLYIVPILVVGYIFYQWAYVYLRNASYAKKTIWNGIVVVTSGIINISLNQILIKEYGEIGIAFSFTCSYLYMLIICWLVNRLYLKIYATSFSLFFKPFVIYIPIFVISFILNRYYQYTSALLFFIKFLILISFIFMILFKYRKLCLKKCSCIFPK